MKWQPFLDFFIMADNDILLPKCKFSIGSVSPSSHHFILGLVSTFKHDDVSMLKTFMCGHSCVMTFLYLIVHNGWCKFSVSSVLQIFCWFIFPHHCILGLVSTFKHGYAYVWWPFCSLPHESSMCTFTLPDIFVIAKKTRAHIRWLNI